MDNHAIERATLADLHAAAGAALAQDLGLRTLTRGSAFISTAAKLAPSSLVVNRTIGLGGPGADDLASVAQVAQAYRDIGFARPFVALDPKADLGQMDAQLKSQNYTRARSWMKFERGDDPLPEAPTDLRVAEIGPEHGTAFAAIACDAFDLGEIAVPWLARLPERPNWRVYMSFDGDEPAGVGTQYIEAGSSWCDWGATRPSHRRRGSQSAIMRRRIRDALAAGVKRIFTCTGEDVPGDPQHSYSNIRRMGFAEMYLVPNYAPQTK